MAKRKKLITGGGRVSPKVQTCGEDAKPVDRAAVRQQITNVISQQAVEMVKLTIEQIKAGNYQPMKYLFEIAGLFPAAEVEGHTPQEDLMLKNVRKILRMSEERAAKLANEDVIGTPAVDSLK